MLKILTGPAGAGQSEQLCRHMVREGVQHPGSSYIAIVPEQATLRMQRQVVREHPRHAVMNIDVVSFERLAYKVFEELGYNGKNILSDTGKVLVLRKVLEESRDDLLVYRKKVHLQGFAEEMKSVVTELRQYTIDDNELFLMQEAALKDNNRLLYEKLQDIRLIYRRFHETIAERYTTQEEILDILARLVKDSRIVRESSLYLDGFTGFTPVQYKLLKELVKYAKEVVITLTLPEEAMKEENPVSGMFQLSSKTFEKLQEMAADVQSPVQVLSPEGTVRLPEVFVCRCADRQQETEFLAGQILSGVISGQYRYRDYAVILSDMESYYPIVRSVFSKAQIPCFIDYKTSLGGNVLARFVLSALQVVTERFSFDSVFAFLKCSLTDLSLNEISLLENYCLEFGIRGVKAWKDEFRKNRRINKGTDQEPEYYWDLNRVNAVRERVREEILDFYKDLGGSAKTAGDYEKAFQKLFLRIRAKEKMEEKSREFYESGEMSAGKEYEQIYDRITELLEQITRLMGTDPLSVRQYTELLSGALEEIRISIIPPSLDAVVVGDLTRTRLDDMKVLFIVGANDGQLPKTGASAGLFTQREREFLKQEHFELAPGVLESLYTQHFYLYLLLSRPKEQLYLTCAGTDREGNVLLPSYLLEELDELQPGLRVQNTEADNAAVWKEQAAGELAAAVRRFADSYSVHERGSGDDNSAVQVLSERELMLLRYFSVSDPELISQIISGAFYTNRPLPLDGQVVLDLYGGALKGSVSRYETYYACPFRHFLSYGLSLEERPEYKVQATDLGTVYHAALEHYAVKLKEHGVSFRDVTDEESHLLSAESMDEAAAEMEKDVLESTGRSSFLLERMKTVMERTTDVLRRQVKDGLYEPDRFEFSFSDDEGRFKGKIDRVDLYDGGDLFVKIIDYKSGSKAFNIRDIYTGLSLQLVAYLKAAVDTVRTEYPDKKVRPGGVYYYQIQDRFVKSEKEAEEKFRMSGLTNSDPRAIEAIDTTLGPEGSSRIAVLSRTRSGSLTSRSEAVSDEEFEHLIQFVQDKIRTVSQCIGQGDVSVHPSYESSTKNACIYCKYRSICKFEPGKWGSDYNMLPEGMDKKAMECEIYGRDTME